MVTCLTWSPSKALTMSTSPGTLADMVTSMEKSSELKHDTNSPAAAGRVGWKKSRSALSLPFCTIAIIRMAFNRSIISPYAI